MQVVTAFLALLTIVHPAAGRVPVTQVAAPLQLNEILAGPARDWDGSGAFSSRDDEWVEVWNPGTEILDLSGYLLTDADQLPRFAFAGTLVPGARKVVFGSESYQWERATGFPAYGLSLSNSGDTVMLWHAAGGDTVLVDTYTYRSHEAAPDRASGRAPDGGTWELFDALDPYVGTVPPLGNGCPPTPGMPNLCEDTPSRTPTWGQLKAIYR